jgi:hypothetical protein
MRLATALATAVVVVALMTGCGDSSVEPGGMRVGTVEPFSVEVGPAGAAVKNCDAGAVDLGGLRATRVSCAEARQVMNGWQQQGSCSSPAGASRVSCSSRSYRCTGTRTDRGTAVSCSRPGRSVAFLARGR